VTKTLEICYKVQYTDVKHKHLLVTFIPPFRFTHINKLTIGSYKDIFLYS